MKTLKTGAFLLLICFTAAAQSISGSWQGALATGSANLRLVFNIDKTADGSYKSTFDSPDQKAFGISCDKTLVVNDSLSIEIKMINGRYTGIWDGKDGITGTFKQGTAQITLNLKRMTAAEKTAEPRQKETARPQTPKPPFNYFSEDVEYDNADKSVHYGATFTRPNGNGKFPAVIIISGSGTQDRNGTLFGHKLYWVLADYLTKNGIAVLRVDDRGAGKSTLGNNFRAVTSLDFSHDVEASLNYLETRADVNKKHLGLIGHSEGGIIAPMVASRRKDVSFVVLWGAPAIGGAKINTDQNVHQLRLAGIDSAAVKAFAELNSRILSLFRSAPNADTLDKKIPLVYHTWKKTQSLQILNSLHAANATDADIIKQYNGLYNLPWMRYFIAYNPENDLSKVKCPVLAVNGEKDTQVNAADNLNLIKQILARNGNKDFEVKALPGLNHLLQTAQTGDVAEYEKIEETMSPAAMKIISDWIKIHTK